MIKHYRLHHYAFMRLPLPSENEPMSFATPEPPAQLYLRQFDRDFGETLDRKKVELNLLSIAKISEGSWRLNYDETLRVMATVTPQNGGVAAKPSEPLRLTIDVAFEKMTDAAWGPWDGAFGTGAVISTTGDLDPPLAASRGVITRLVHEAERPEIRKALRTAAAYDRTHGQNP